MIVMSTSAETVPTWVLAGQPSLIAVAEFSWACVHSGVACGSPIWPGGRPTTRFSTFSPAGPKLMLIVKSLFAPACGLAGAAVPPTVSACAATGSASSAIPAASTAPMPSLPLRIAVPIFI